MAQQLITMNSNDLWPNDDVDKKTLNRRSSNLWPSLFDDMYHWAWTATTLVDNVVDLKRDT